jgi:transcription initiation factor TFIID subunit TAF12
MAGATGTSGTAPDRSKMDQKRSLVLTQKKKLEDALKTTQEDLEKARVTNDEPQINTLSDRETQIINSLNRVNGTLTTLDSQIAALGSAPPVNSKSAAASGSSKKSMAAASNGQSANSKATSQEPGPTPVKKESSATTPASRISAAANSSSTPASNKTVTTVPSNNASKVTLPPKDSLTSATSNDAVAGSLVGDASTDHSTSNLTTQSSGGSSSSLLGKRKLADLVTQIDPTQRVDPDVHEFLMDLSDEFVESATRFACQLARHRQGKTLEVRDLQLYLESHYRLRVPGFFSTTNESIDIVVARRKPNPIHAHQTRIAAVKKAIFDENNLREKFREKAKDKEVSHA